MDGSFLASFNTNDLGGNIKTLVKLATEKSERMHIDINAGASTPVSSAVIGGSAPYVSTSSDTTLSLSTQTGYRYWITWADGREELMALAMDCAPGQKLMFCLIYRHIQKGERLHAYPKK